VLRGWRLGVALLAAMVFFVVGLTSGGGELQALAWGGLEVVPFVLVALLAQLGLRRTWARVLCWVALGATLLGLLLFALSISLMTFARGSLTPGSIMLDQGARPTLGLLALGIAGGLALSSLVLSRRVRDRLARWLPINPGSFVHTVALWTTLAASVIFLLPLAVLGAPPLLELLRGVEGAATSQQEVLQQSFYPLLWLIPGVVLATGYGVHRNLRQAAHRLGVAGISGKQVFFALLVGLGLVVAIQVGSPVLDRLWQWLGLPATDTSLVDKLFSSYMTPLGVVALSLSAGVGEELVFRGLLQPRTGILLANVLFTSLHAWQYNVDGLAVVFFVGLVIGWARRRTGNTIVAIIIHAFYDFGLILSALLLA
jgi:membrane protease YdiL (CAAX protease family)